MERRFDQRSISPNPRIPHLEHHHSRCRWCVGIVGPVGPAVCRAELVRGRPTVTAHAAHAMSWYGLPTEPVMPMTVPAKERRRSAARSIRARNVSGTSIAVPPTAGRDVRYAAAPAARAWSMKSWPSRSATSGTNICPRRIVRVSKPAPSMSTSRPTNRPPVAAATSLALNRIAAHGTVGATWDQAIESDWWCCSAVSRPSTT